MLMCLISVQNTEPANIWDTVFLPLSVVFLFFFTETPWGHINKQKTQCANWCNGLVNYALRFATFVFYLFCFHTITNWSKVTFKQIWPQPTWQMRNLSKWSTGNASCLQKELLTQTSAVCTSLLKRKPCARNSEETTTNPYWKFLGTVYNFVQTVVH